jgi:hypothetical protein
MPSQQDKKMPQSGDLNAAVESGFYGHLERRWAEHGVAHQK